MKSETGTDFAGHTRVEDNRGTIIATDTFDVVEKYQTKEDSGYVYDWYVVENHYLTEERFTPEKADEVDEELTKQRGDIDYIAMMSDIELETGGDE